MKISMCVCVCKFVAGCTLAYIQTYIYVCLACFLHMGVVVLCHVCLLLPNVGSFYFIITTIFFYFCFFCFFNLLFVFYFRFWGNPLRLRGNHFLGVGAIVDNFAKYEAHEWQATKENNFAVVVVVVVVAADNVVQ